MSNFTLKGSLLATTVIAGMTIAVPAYAQDASNQPGTQTSPPTTTTGAPDPEKTEEEVTPVANANEGSTQEEIVVTGSLIRRTNTETPSPVTVMSSEALDQRGINTVAEAVQRTPANNAGAITQGWNTGFNFASGANAVSLRGLTVQSTLTIFDGLRMAPYPLADDGRRNFVDLNTIPNAIIDRIEVLRDGASSTYGADAIAGVVNVITKKEITGIHLNGSVGTSWRGDAAEKRVDLTVGFGKLDEQGINAYVSAEWQKQGKVMARDREYPFNTLDWSQICGEASGVNPAFPQGSKVCLDNGVWNSVQNGSFNGFFNVPVPFAFPVSDTGARTGPLTMINPALGCQGLTPVQVPSTAPSSAAGQTACEFDWVERYLSLQPEQERRGLTGRVTARLGEIGDAYAMANWYEVKTNAEIVGLNFNASTTPPGQVAFNPVYLPVYVCPNATYNFATGTTDCTAATPGATLNPNNPYAAQGQRAQLFFRDPRPRTVDTRARSLRGVLGVAGSFLRGLDYDVNFTASRVRLLREQRGYLIPQRLADVVARGTYNFMDPAATPQDVLDYISPDNSTLSVSKLYQGTATVGGSVFDLPGGPLGVAVGLQYRKESVDAPSANPQLTNPYERYYSVNSVATQGERNVKSAFFEVSAPIISNLELIGSGRYDSYSSGQKNFSPKIGAKFTPIREVAVRGTWSKGFRIPSFSEAYGLPTTGYISFTVNCATYTAFCAAHNNNAYATSPISIGLTSTGNPSLDPEKSTSFTAGVIFQPIRNIDFTVDYWNIKIRDIISGAQYAPALAAWYSSGGNVNLPGINVVPANPDPDNPNAPRHIQFIEYSYLNANELDASGIDFAVNGRFDLGGVRWSSSLQASYLHKYNKRYDNGDVEKYAGTLSPCDVTSCSGAPRWRGDWQNTFQFGRATITGTAYYTSGYDQASTDYGGVPGDCYANIGISVVAYEDGTPVMCRAKPTWNFDMTGAYEVSDRMTLYMNVMNVFDIGAPFEPSAAYHLFGYNPAWAGPNIIGRHIRVGTKLNF